MIVYRENGHAFPYLVTAAHVAKRVQPTGGVVIRVNDKEGGSMPLEVDGVTWAYHPDKNVDVSLFII